MRTIENIAKFVVIVLVVLFDLPSALAWEIATLVPWTERTGNLQVGGRLPMFHAVRGGPDNLLHIVWQEDNVNCPITAESCPWQLWYAKQEPSCSMFLLGEPQLLYEIELPNSAGINFRPRVAVRESDGCVAVLHWAEGTSSSRALQFLWLGCEEEPGQPAVEIPMSDQVGTGRPVDMLFDASGQVRLAFVRRTPNHLIYGVRTSTGWSMEVAAFVFNQHYPLDMELDFDGNPVIAIHDAGPIQVALYTRLPGCEGEECWERRTVDDGGDYSVALEVNTVTGSIFVPYNTSFWWSDPVGELWAEREGSIEFIYGVPDQNPGRFVDALLDNGNKNARATHYKQPTGRLYYSKWGPDFLTTEWQTELVHDPGDWWVDEGRFPNLTKAHGEHVEIVFWKTRFLVFGVDTTTDIMIAANPSFAETSAVCPNVPTCNPFFGCTETTVTPVISGNFQIRECLTCQQGEELDPICPLIYCPPDQPAGSVCDRCARFGTLDRESDFKGQQAAASTLEPQPFRLGWSTRRKAFIDLTGETRVPRGIEGVLTEVTGGGWSWKSVQ